VKTRTKESVDGEKEEGEGREEDTFILGRTIQKGLILYKILLVYTLGKRGPNPMLVLLDNFVFLRKSARKERENNFEVTLSQPKKVPPLF
jgi:hypothetical protein